MSALSTSEAAKIRKLVNAYNTIVNFFWTIINVGPISIFCYQHMGRNVFVIFLSVAFLSIFLPRSFHDKFELKGRENFYKKIGVPFIARFTQNGAIINGLLRKRYPGYNVVTTSNTSIRKLLNQTYAFEKFHYMFLLFFVFATVYAVMKHFYAWAWIITITNLVYNLYPILLQQYNRNRLRRTATRFSNKSIT